MAAEALEDVDDGLVLTIIRSKTDQEGAGRQVDIPYGSNRATCPVRSLGLAGYPYRPPDKPVTVSRPRHPVDSDRVYAVRQTGLPASEANAMAHVVNLLGDPLRSRILSALLVSDELCVGDLAIALDANEDAVSYALRLLRSAGVVQRRREGRMGYYRLPDGAARQELGAVLAHLRALAALQPDNGADGNDV